MQNKIDNRPELLTVHCPGVPNSGTIQVPNDPVVRDLLGIIGRLSVEDIHLLHITALELLKMGGGIA